MGLTIDVIMHLLMGRFESHQIHLFLNVGFCSSVQNNGMEVAHLPVSCWVVQSEFESRWDDDELLDLYFTGKSLPASESAPSLG